MSSNDSLRDQIGKELQAVLNKAAPYPTRPTYFGDHLDSIMHLIEQAQAERDIDSRIDELRWVANLDPRFDWASEIDAHLAELKKLRKEVA